MGKIKIGVIVENHPYDIMEFQEMLWSLENCECYVQPFDLFVQDNENQEKYDALLFYNMNLPLPQEGSPAYFYLTQRLGEKSQGIILLHHALLSFPKWDLWTRVCGVKVRCEDGVFQYHQKETVREHIAEKNHPITKDMQDFSLIDEVSVCDNQTFFALSKNFRQHTKWYNATSQNVSKHIPRTHTWKLVFISHQNKFAIAWQSL